MSVADSFSNFCSSLRMKESTIANISFRTKQITKRINNDFRNISSDSNYCLFVGSYGRGTEIHVSDIDLIVELPYDVYRRFNSYQYNGQSALLQNVKESIKKTYSSTHLSGDGQVIQLKFTDNICFEILPAFINDDMKSYTYPDANKGGSWKITNPRAEITTMNAANTLWNKNLKRLCRMMRAWKDNWNVPIGGLLIDTLCYNFLSQWEFRDKSFYFYDWMTRDFFNYLKNQDPLKNYWLAPGSNQHVLRKGLFEFKASQCHDLAIEAIQYEKDGMPCHAVLTWREIYGSRFPI
ncbi:TPA: nucleotidyltransferase domain-containing protein [Legionella pneumophila]|nr:nucleotidyltransferase domain-containing protein [Legionella pneumophila]